MLHPMCGLETDSVKYLLKQYPLNKMELSRSDWKDDDSWQKVVVFDLQG